MVALDKAIQLKSQGMSEPQMMDSLKQEGFSPKEVQEALSQLKIKSALNSDVPKPETPSGMQAPSMEASPTTQPIVQNQQMQPSIAPVQEIQEPVQQMQKYPNMNEIPEPQMQMSPSTQQIPSAYNSPTMDYNESEYQNPPYSEQTEYYPDYPEYEPQGTDIETINDIAEQIAEEKNAKLKKQISSLESFKEGLISDVKRIDDRLTKMERVFNELQIAILEKVGDYGKDIQNISKEMHMTQDSFSKILNPLTENIKELQKITGKTTHHTSKTINKTTPKSLSKTSKIKTLKKIPKEHRKTKSKKPKPKIEDYMR